MSFHVRQDVAPLKHRLRQLIDWRAGPFPRPTGRGPIEANRKCAVPPDDCGLFPRPTGRGPIEAMDGAIHMTAIDVFPRPTDRAPIEADRRAAPRRCVDPVSTSDRTWPH